MLILGTMVPQTFLSFRTTFCFTNPDYWLIRMTSPPHPNYFRLARVYCTCNADQIKEDEMKGHVIRRWGKLQDSIKMC
jgi:hypothetical protein